MKAVGVKQLKSRLSEYLRLVKAGDTILVTERGDVVAEIRPARRQKIHRDAWNDVMDELAEAGEVTRASLPMEGERTWRPRDLGLPPDAIVKLLDELREDRLGG